MSAVSCASDALFWPFCCWHWHRQVVLAAGGRDNRSLTVPGQLLFARVPVASAWADLALPTLYRNADRILFAPCHAAPGDVVWGLAKQIEGRFGALSVCLECDTGCSDSMESYYEWHQHDVLAGVVFSGNTSLLLQPGSSVQYHIRIDGDEFLPGINGTVWTPSVGVAPDLSSLAFSSLFSPVQLAVERGILAARSNGTLPLAALLDMFVQQFPVSPYQVTTSAVVGRTIVAAMTGIIYIVVVV